MSYSDHLLDCLTVDLKVPRLTRRTEQEVPRYLRVATFLLYWELVDTIAWAEHTSDWDFELQVTVAAGEHVYFGNPEVKLFFKGAAIEDLKEWLQTETHRLGESYEDRFFELKVHGEYDDEDGGSATHYHNLERIEKLVVTV